MGLVEQILLPPTAQHFALLPYLILLLLLLHLPFVAMLLVTSLLSVVHRSRDAELAGDFMNLVTPNRAVWITFGLLPLLCLPLIVGQYMYGAAIPVTDYFERIIVLSVIAQGLLYGYRSTGNRLVGAAGHLALVVTCFFLISLLDLIAQPGRWAFIDGPLPHLFSSQVAIHFAVFSLLALLLTGGALLFFYFRWPDRKVALDAPHRTALRRWGLGMLLAAAIALPIHMVADFITAPTPALSISTFAAAIGVTALLFVISVLVVAMLKRGHERYGTTAFVLASAVFLIVVLDGQTRRATANQEHVWLVGHRAAETRAELAATQEALYTQLEPDVALGLEIFEQRCSACHLWDSKLVGPPYRSVLVKYLSKPDDLTAFIRNPAKVDPAYPIMPNPGLSQIEAMSVATYLLGEIDKRGKEEQP